MELACGGGSRGCWVSLGKDVVTVVSGLLVVCGPMAVGALAGVGSVGGLTLLDVRVGGCFGSSLLLL